MVVFRAVGWVGCDDSAGVIQQRFGVHAAGDWSVAHHLRLDLSHCLQLVLRKDRVHVHGFRPVASAHRSINNVNVSTRKYKHCLSPIERCSEEALMGAGVQSHSYWLDTTTIEALVEATCAEISATAVIALDA